LTGGLWRRLEEKTSRSEPSWIFFIQAGFTVLPTVVDADDGDPVSLHIKSNDRALFVVRDAQTGSHIVSQCAAVGKGAQALAVSHDPIGVG